MKVYVALYSHKHGYDVSVYATAELAEKERQAIAAKWWDDEIPGEPMPPDPKRAADLYFEVMENREEFFNITETEVIWS